MGIFEKLGLRKDWAKEEAKLATKEEQQKPAEPKSEYEAQFEAFLKNVPGQREEIERGEKIELDKKEIEMLQKFVRDIGYGDTAKAENRLGETGEGLNNGLARIWGKLKEVATAAYIVPKEMSKFALGQGADVAKGLGEGIKEFPAAAWSEMQGAGYSIGKFAELRVTKPAKEIYGKYSEVAKESLGIGAEVAATKYEAASEWVKVNSAKSWFQGKEALGKFRASLVRTNESFNEKLKQWPVERQLKRAKEKAFKTQEAALLAEQKAAQASETAVQAAKEYDALRSAFENAG